MPTITLRSAWQYRTPLHTIDFPKGRHTMSDDAAARARAEGVAAPKREAKSDGNAD
jgi:hypothetical protein